MSSDVFFMVLPLLMNNQKVSLTTSISHSKNFKHYQKGIF